MTGPPHDTTREAWELQQAIHRRMDPGERVRIAAELSEAVLAIQRAGIRDRHPSWDERRVLRELIRERHGKDLRDPA